MSTDAKRRPSQRDRFLAESARQHQEEALDDALKNTFPASDPVSIEQPGGRPDHSDGALADSGPSEGRAMSTQKLFSVALCLVAADYSNSANAQQAEGTKTEAALTAKIKCEDFRKNADGTWTSGPNTKIGTNAFSNHTFDTRGVSVGGADLATVLNRKCGR